jgi:hypothetical protein
MVRSADWGRGCHRLPGARPLTAEELLTPRNARILLGLGLAASGALLLVWQSHLTFLIDDWELLLSRRGFNAHVLFNPHANHLIVGPVLVYKAIQATIGMDSIVPYAAAAIACFLASVLLLFIYLSRRVGDWIALAAVLPILFMGTAYEDLLTAFQINYFGSVAFGIGALLAIERRDRRGDVIACVLLLASLAFAEIALAFAAGVLLAIVIQRGPLRRCWVIAVPAVLYALWYAIYEAGESSSLSLQNVAVSPAYVVDGFASSLGSLFGQGTPILFHGEGGLPWGRPLLVAAIVGATFWLLRPRTTVRASILIPLAVGLVFWLLTAANYQPGRPPTASRYQYVGAVFVLLIAGELAAGWRPAWRAILAGLAVSIAATAGNLVTLHDGYRASAASSATVRGGLGGLEIAADHVSPDFVLTGQNSNFNYFTLVRAGPYLSASEKFGSPAYSQSELASASEPAKEAADKVLAAALPVSLRPGLARPAPGNAAPQLVGPPTTRSSAQGSCVTVQGGAGSAPILALPSGGAILKASGSTPHPLSLRRFAAESFPVSVGALSGSASLVVPTDRSSRPWQLQIGGAGQVTACGV